jgi:anti-sigma B factor antagonist
MEIVERLVDGVTVLDLKGRLVLSEGERTLRVKIDDVMAHGQKSILVNLDGVTYLDSAGVGAIVWKYVTLRRQGGMLKLLGLQLRTHRVLSVTKLLNVLESFTAEADAVASFKALR